LCTSAWFLCTQLGHLLFNSFLRFLFSFSSLPKAIDIKNSGISLSEALKPLAILTKRVINGNLFKLRISGNPFVHDAVDAFMKAEDGLLEHSSDHGKLLDALRYLFQSIKEKIILESEKDKEDRQLFSFGNVDADLIATLRGPLPVHLRMEKMKLGPLDMLFMCYILGVWPRRKLEDSEDVVQLPSAVPWSPELCADVDQCEWFLARKKLAAIKVDDDGVESLLAETNWPGAVEKLYFEGNKLGDDGARVLSVLLRRSVICGKSPLTDLVLRDNFIGTTGVNHIIKATAEGDILRGGYLDLSRNDLCLAFSGVLDEGQDALHGLYHSPLKKINLSECNLSGTFLRGIARAVYQNNTIEYLLLSNNEITDIGVRILEEELKEEDELECLDVTENPISDDGIDDVMKLLGENNNVKVLVR
jgi:hypothetical protein